MNESRGPISSRRLPERVFVTLGSSATSGRVSERSPAFESAMFSSFIHTGRLARELVPVDCPNVL